MFQLVWHWADDEEQHRAESGGVPWWRTYGLQTLRTTDPTDLRTLQTLQTRQIPSIRSPPWWIEAFTPGNFTLRMEADHGLLANDSGDGLWVSDYESTTELGGQVTVAADGSFEYAPPLGVSWSEDGFTYEVTSSTLGTATGLVEVIIEDCVWFVDAGGPPGDGTSDAPFQHLQDAQQASAPNDVIAVSPGSYDSLILQSGQRVVGAESDVVVAGRVVLAGEGNKPQITTSSGVPITMADDATLEAFEVYTPQVQAVISEDIVGVTIRNLDVLHGGSTMPALWISGGGDIVLEELTVNGATPSDAISILGTDNIEVRYSTFHDVFGTAVYVDDSTDVRVLRNEMGGVGTGVKLLGCSGSLDVSDNTMTDVTYKGIGADLNSLANDADLRIAGNQLSTSNIAAYPFDVGIWVDLAGDPGVLATVEVNDNVVENAASFGIATQVDGALGQARAAPTVTLSDNVIQGSSTVGMQLTTLGVAAANYVVAGYDVIDDGGMLPDVADALVVKAFGSSTLRAVLDRLQLHEVTYGARLSAVDSATMIVSAAVAEVDAFSVGLEAGLSGDASLDLTVTNWTLPNGGARLWAIDVTNSQGLATPLSAYLHTNQVELVQVLGSSGTSVGLATARRSRAMLTDKWWVARRAEHQRRGGDRW